MKTRAYYRLATPSRRAFPHAIEHVVVLTTIMEIACSILEWLGDGERIV